jgi:CheY-like chemotaxis protein
MRILVVEDEPACMKLAHVVLAADGHEVAGAGAVDSAIAEIARSEPEVILLDLELPHINGLDLARKLKRDPATRHIVIIAVTAYPERFPREKAIAAGCDAYIVKPIDTRRLNDQVTSVTDKLR